MRPRSEARNGPNRNDVPPAPANREPGARARSVDLSRRTAIALLIPLCLAATSARADLIRYAWSGYVEATAASGNPWGLQGDGLAVTNTDGSPFTLVAHVDPDAVDLDGSLNPNFARFAPVSATLKVGGHVAVLSNPQVQFSNDSFSGLFDAVRFQTGATLFDTPLSFPADVRLAPATFALATPATSDPPPTFPDTVPIQFGGTVNSALITYAANATVSGELETCSGPEPVVWAAPGIGVADGIAVTVTNLTNPDLDTFPLDGPDFAAGEQCSNAQSLTLATGSDWRVDLEPATGALLVYAKYWRGPGTGTSAVAYQFDAPFTISSGLTGATVSNGNTRLSLPASGFHDGILRFEGPIASLAVEVDSTALAEQAMTFAVVPEPGLAAGLSIAAAMLLALGRARVDRARVGRLA